MMALFVMDVKVISLDQDLSVGKFLNIQDMIMSLLP